VPPLLRARSMVWWRSIPATWLPSRIEGRLTKPLYRRSMSDRRSSDGGCCHFRTLCLVFRAPDLAQSLSLLRRIHCQRTSFRECGSFGTRVLMGTLSDRISLPSLAPFPAPPIFSVFCRSCSHCTTPSLLPGYRRIYRRSSASSIAERRESSKQKRRYRRSQ